MDPAETDQREGRRRLRVLISAYSCQPGKGSEPGVGWNIATGMAKHHDVWVLTRTFNRPVIEAALAKCPVKGLEFIYFDLPRWATWWKKDNRGIQAYYYLWQLLALRSARGAHQRLHFDIAHHATFVKYWAPSCLARLGIPYLWGPVGGGDATPLPFWRTYSLRGRWYEFRREVARWLAEKDPAVRRTARHCSHALATTKATRARALALGATACDVLSQTAIAPEELAAVTPAFLDEPVRFVSIGSLLHLKGFHLGLEAFARANLQGAEYWIIGDGPERGRLERLALTLGIHGSVSFLGQLDRTEVIRRLGDCTALVHPSLHESGGFVCVEAMASGRPVVCLALGGPAVLVGEDCGFVVAAQSPSEVIEALAFAMTRLGCDAQFARDLGEAGRRRVERRFLWSSLCAELDRHYRRVAVLKVNVPEKGWWWRHATRSKEPSSRGATRRRSHGVGHIDG